jgi:hypothetical protein
MAGWVVGVSLPRQLILSNFSHISEQLFLCLAFLHVFIPGALMDCGVPIFLYSPPANQRDDHWL